MSKFGWKVAQYALVGMFFSLGGIGVAGAANRPGSCADGSQPSSGNANSCQFEVNGGTTVMPDSTHQAPAPKLSLGIRLDANTTYVLFANYFDPLFINNIDPLFINNNSNNDIFVPQNTSTAFQSFIDHIVNSPSSQITSVGVVEPTQNYMPSPITNGAACNPNLTQTSNTTIASIPAKQYSTSPFTVNYYMPYPLPDGTTPSLSPLGTTAQPTITSHGDHEGSASLSTQANNPLEITLTQTGCNGNCATYKEEQQVKFVPVSIRSNGQALYKWTPAPSTPQQPNPLAQLYKSTDGGQTYAPVAGCTVNAVCGSASNSSATSMPTLSTSLCSYGTASGLIGSGVGNTSAPWSWTCNGNNGGASVVCSTIPNGLCGAANGQSVTAAPSQPGDLCANGTPTVPVNTSGDGVTWAWSCAGYGTGMTAACVTVPPTCTVLDTGMSYCPTAVAGTGFAHAYLYDLSSYKNLNYASMDMISSTDLIPNANVYASEINIADRIFTQGFPSYSQLQQWFGTCYDGNWTAPATDSYTFVSAVDDTVALWIDGNLVGQNAYGKVEPFLFRDDPGSGDYSDYIGYYPVAFHPVTLTAGPHSVVIQYIQAWPQNLGLQLWSLPTSQANTLATQNLNSKTAFVSMPDADLMQLSAPAVAPPMTCPH